MESAMSEAKKARAVGFNHIALEVGDIEEALAFYGRLFDFKLRGKSEDSAFIDLGDQFLALQKGRKQPADDGRHFGLVVDDKEAVRKALAEVGVEPLPGRFLDFLKQAWPRLPVLGLDMSEPYVRYARRHLKRWSRINLTVGNAELLPVPDESQDAVTSIFLFHELPPKVRRIVFRECARVVKPGGRLVLVDSLQRGDQPDYDGLRALL